jgi:hypothetical protein
MDLVTRRRRGLLLARTLCALVALAAGFVGVLMLIAPASTGRYFSWALGPAPLAALVGGCYVASAVVFGWAAARERWAGLRGLCVAVFGLTLPTLAATARHHDVFDFSRWPAVAWILLFVASPVLFGVTLYLLRGPVTARGQRLRPWARAVLAVVGAGYAALAVALWAWPTTIGRHGPFAAAGLGARFAGSWAAFLAIAAGYAAVRARWEEARVPVLALAVWPACVLGAAVLRLDDLRSGAARPAYLAGLAVLAATAGVVLAAGRAKQPAARPALDGSLALPA